MRKHLITFAFVFGALTIGACASGLKIKIYITDIEKGGLYRDQEKELIKWQDAGGYYCVNKQDMRKLAEAYSLCKDLIEDK